MGIDRLFDSIKDVIKFEKSNLKGMIKKIKDDPKRLLSPVPMVDPVGTKIGSGLGFGEDDPLVTQMGGATEQSYATAEAEGINTAPGRAMHDVAQTIAASYAGGYGAEQAAGAMPQLPAGWTENIPEQIQGFIPGGGSGAVLTPAQAGTAGQVFAGAATAGYLKDEHDFRTDPGFPPLPEGTYVPGDISPNYQSFMDRYGAGQPGGAAPGAGPPGGGGGSYGSFMERYGGGRMPETRHQPGRPGSTPQPAFSYQPNPPVGWV